jgi:CPA1 family monovalent cation:H+ antiporter
LAALLLSRIVFVYGMTHMGAGRDLGRAWILAAWAGTRGPISVLAAFTVPAVTDSGKPMPGRELLISITFVVMLASLLLAPTISIVARRLDLPADDDRAVMRRARLATARAALDRLEDVAASADRREEPLPVDVVYQLRADAEARVGEAVARAEAGGGTAPLHLKLMRQVGLEMTRAEQEELKRLRDEGGLPDSIMRQLQMEIDQRARSLMMPG